MWTILSPKTPFFLKLIGISQLSITLFLIELSQFNSTYMALFLLLFIYMAYLIFFYRINHWSFFLFFHDDYFFWTRHSISPFFFPFFLLHHCSLYVFPGCPPTTSLWASWDESLENTVRNYKDTTEKQECLSSIYDSYISAWSAR